MSFGYRTVLSTQSTAESLSRITQILEEWALNKKRFPHLPETGESTTNPENALLTAFAIDDSERGILGFRWTLSEEWGAPGWYTNDDTSRTGKTTITLVAAEGLDWLWVDIEPPVLEYVDRDGKNRSEVQQSGTPAFVSTILSEIEMQDGNASPVADIESVVAPNHVADLIDILQDTERRGSVYVFSVPAGEDVTRWKTRVSRVLGRIEGMGYAFYLEPAALAELNSRVSQWHIAPRGAIRTYLPGADLRDPKDSLRHKVLHASTIRNSSDARLKRIIRNAQVAGLGDWEIPEALTQADHEFLKQQSAKTFSVLHGQGADASTIADLLQRLQDAEELLEIALADNTALRVEAKDVKRVVTDLEIDHEISYRETSELRIENERLRGELVFLRAELAKYGSEGAASAFAFADARSYLTYPESFADLVERMHEIPGIQFYGDPSDAEELDEFSDLGESALLKAWDSLVTFGSYVEARAVHGYGGTVRDYVSDSSHGFPMRISQVKWNESETVRNNPRLSQQRIVSGVPETIAAEGTFMFTAHIALATRRANAPRLYFADAFDAAGHVMIGHIGKHLDNAHTN